MSPRIVTLSSIKEQLRDGVDPERLFGAEYLGEGMDRKAYRVGPFVVKYASEYTHNTPTVQADVRQAGMRVAPTLTLHAFHGSFNIQMAYRTLNQEQEDRFRYTSQYLAGGNWDVHGRNVGYDRRGRLVAFDW
jgi:hypothetical protein